MTSIKQRLREDGELPTALAWSTEQKSVIDSNGHSRILVDAGPGTGKTAVGCMRIAKLLNDGFCSAHEIIVISFTNTAVYEIRERIKAYLSDPTAVSNIRVTTLDSFAGKIRAGFDAITKSDSSFDENITKASKLIFTNPDVSDFIKTIKHVVIDEAQDVVGERSLFILELISKLDKDAGVTVLCDEAQAIYGFTNENPIDELSTDTLPDSIRRFNKHFEVRFDSLVLRNVYRTENKRMQKLFLEGRDILRDAKGEPSLIYEKLRSLIVETSEIELPSAKDILVPDENDPMEMRQDWTDVFLIFRKRGEALQASTYLGAQSRRIRLSGLPTPIKPWLADVFWNFEDEEITESDFRSRFENATANKGYEISAEQAWSLILSEAGLTSKKVSVRNLRARLSRYSPNPDFMYSDYGIGGPIFSSIHASKGRESNLAILFLPKQHIRTEATAEEIVEEAKVLFVGATRAKEEVLIFNGEDYTPISSLKTSGRAFSYLSKKNFSVNVEIGRREDVSPYSLVGERLFKDYADVANGQRHLRNNPFEVLECTVFGGSLETDYQYSVVRKQTDKNKQRRERTIFYLDQAINKDLWALSNFISSRSKPPSFFSPIYSLGVRTMVLPVDDVRLSFLHEPWRSSGFIHAPMLSGYPYIRFDRKGF